MCQVFDPQFFMHSFHLSLCNELYHVVDDADDDEHPSYLYQEKDRSSTYIKIISERVGMFNHTNNTNNNQKKREVKISQSNVMCFL